MKRPNGAGSVYKLPNGKYKAVVTLCYDDNKRAVKTKTCDKKRDALAAIEELKKTPKITDITFSALYDAWSKQHYEKVSRAMADGYKAAYKHCSALYKRKFAQIKYQELQDVVDACQLGRRSKQDIKSLIGNLYIYAMKREHAEKNLAKLIELPTKEKSKSAAFTKEESGKLWEAYNNGDEFAGYILIMIYSGMRYGEISTILKVNISLPDRKMIGGIKSEAGIDREIPIKEKIFPIVEKLYLQNKEKLVEIPERKFYNLYYETLARCQIRRLPPHSCRHTFFTRMALAKVQPAVISETGGHEDYATTMTYTHIPFDEKLAAVNSIE